MAGRWALAFSAAAILALVGASIMRRRASRPTSDSELRRFGGVVFLATLVGLAFVPRLPERVAALAVAAALMAVVGWIAERGVLRGPRVLVAIVVVSIIPVAAGVRLDMF